MKMRIIFILTITLVSNAAVGAQAMDWEKGIIGKWTFTDSNDIEAMSNYSILILSDENKLEEFKNRAFKKAETYDINNVVPRYEKIYKKALNSFK